jgi:cytochrome c oxidase subunit IV
VPASFCLIIAIIWLSLNFDLRIRKLLRFSLLEFSTYDYFGLVGELHIQWSLILQLLPLKELKLEVVSVLLLAFSHLVLKGSR